MYSSIENYDDGKLKHKFKYRLIYAVVFSLIFGSVITLKEAMFNVAIPHKYDKFAIAVKTGKDIIDIRTPVLFKTFLSNVFNKILISDASHDPIGEVPVLDVYSQLEVANYANGAEIVFSSDRNTRISNHNSLNILQLEPNEGSQGWKYDAHKNLPGFRELWNKFPYQDWYMMIDDDTYVFIDNLNDFVVDYNSSEPYYFGLGNTFVGCDGIRTRGESTMIAQGGSGILISRGAMQRLEPMWNLCITKYQDCWAGDVRVGLCLRDAAVLLTNVKLFHTNPPNDNTVFSHPCEKPISFHHLLVNQIEELYQLEIAMKKKLFKKAVLMEYLLPLWISSKPKLNTIRSGDEYGAISTADLTSCIKMCEIDKLCVSYSFNHLTNECSKQTKINVLEKKLGTTSGIVPHNFKCTSAKDFLKAKRAMVGL